MQFREIINAKLSKVPDRPMMQKESFPVSIFLQQYLKENDRDFDLPISYNDLLYYSHADALKDANGKLTHWETAVYDDAVREKLYNNLVKAYCVLKKFPYKMEGHTLKIDRVDFCEFGNSIPFRISLSDKAGNQHDIFYIKPADASRIYGLELEHLLSPDNTNFLYHNNTLVEEHINGIAGDVFIQNASFKGARAAALAKEFVQFNERCFARLLGDMRSYNFAVQMESGKPEGTRIRAIDFDQQSYEGSKSLYLPQFFKENFQYAQLVLQNLSNETILQYQVAERKNMRERVVKSRKRLMGLLNIMTKEELSENYKVLLLKKDLNEHFGTSAFSNCKTMGSIVKKQLKQVLR